MHCPKPRNFQTANPNTTESRTRINPKMLKTSWSLALGIDGLIVGTLSSYNYSHVVYFIALIEEFNYSSGYLKFFILLYNPDLVYDPNGSI